jgi:hypothetical protein
MSSITLVRIVRPERVVYHGRNILEDKVVTVGVEIVGDDGRKVTLAFDGRYDRDCETYCTEREEYMTYNDCPIITDMPGGESVQSGPVEDVVAVLRAALNNLI